jgi:UDPglucose 6-dehydrogenase
MDQLTGFLGLSHLGLVSSIGWASLGNPVVGVDPDPEIIDLLNQRRVPVHEPGLSELLSTSRTALTFTTAMASLRECPLVILSRDVPTGEGNRSDLSAVERLVEAAIPHLPPHATFVIMSQVPPGFTRSVASRLSRDRPGDGLRVYYWVETLVLGRAVDRYLHPERIIVGCEDPGAPLSDVLAQGLRAFDCPVLSMRYESAELAKMAINLYLSGAVTYANTLADLCEKIGADWSEVVPALRSDARIGPAAYIRPSLGISGGNLERDLVALSRLGHDKQVDTSYIDTIISYNARRTDWVLQKLETLVFAEVSKPTIAVWGLAYKKGTQSVKNSPARRVMSALEGRATLRAYDPVVRSPISWGGAALVPTRDDALPGADCLLIMTDWEEFASIDPTTLRRAMRRPLVIDCAGVLEARRGRLDGIQYVTIGRGELK